MLISYQAVIKAGQIQLQTSVDLPEGLQVLVVVPVLTEEMEDQALNRAMDEALAEPLLTREQALALLAAE